MTKQLEIKDQYTGIDLIRNYADVPQATALKGWSNVDS